MLYLIVSELATAVNQNPEIFRDIFTYSSEKEKIVVISNSLVRGNPASDWGATLNLFEEQLAKKVPPTTMDALLPRFSTETIESRAATLVAFMDMAQSFYVYKTRSMCGIPRIRLDGTAEDWQKLFVVTEEMSRIFGNRTPLLKMYFQHLIPLVSKIADQASGTALDNEFWSSIYKFNSVSGGTRANGWITGFLAFIRDKSGMIVPKPEKFFDWKSVLEENRDNDYVGLGSSIFPTHVSSAPFLWIYLGEKLPMTYIGGILGIENDGGFVSPQLSYAVLNGDLLPPAGPRTATYRR
jgi:hypothetical protein